MAKSMKVSTSSLASCQAHDSNWDIAIDEAQKEIDSLKVRLNRMQTAIQIFRQNKKDGVTWHKLSNLSESREDLS
jgi:hypothetical protein